MHTTSKRVGLAALLLGCGGASVALLDCVSDVPATTSSDDGGAEGAEVDTGAGDATQGGDVVTNDAPDSANEAGFVFDDPCVGDASHTACCDFDDDAGINCLSALQVTGGSLTLADAQATSKPHSAHSVATGYMHYAYGRLTLPGSQMVTCAFDLWVEHNDDQGNVFAVNAGNDIQGIVLVAHPGQAGAIQLQLFGPQSNDAGADVGPGNVPGNLSIPARTWVRITMGLTSPPTGNVFGDVAILSRDAGAPLHIKTSFATPNVFGATVALDFVKSNTTDIYVDNVVCDSK